MSSLFGPVRLGRLVLPNRIVMAPMARRRAGPTRVATAIMATYYAQRASAGLIVSEATSISPQGVMDHGTPGLWSDEQAEGWRQVTQAVHAAGGRIVAQLWHAGRISDPAFLGGQRPVAPSAVRPAGFVRDLAPARPYGVPRALEPGEIPGIVGDFGRAATLAKRAGFDGVEIHAGNGYLVDQFLQDRTNRRTDRYGGTLENRVRFLGEVVDAVAAVWGADAVGVHLRPGGEEHDMGDSDPGALFGHVAAALRQRGVGFLFIREREAADSLLGFLKQTFAGPVIANDGMDKAAAERLIGAGTADAVAFGWPFIANPDLVARLSCGAALAAVDPKTVHGEGALGYTDYPALPKQTR